MARIVFDLDGTLIDSAPDLQAVANTLLEAEGRAPVGLAETRGFIGRGAAVFVARMRAARDIPDAAQERLLAAFLDRYERAVDLTRPYPGVVEALEALRAAGHALGLCTNKPEAPCRAVLAHLGLAGHFGTIVGGDTLAVRKPDPAALRAAFEALGAGPRLYVGDSEVDAETARRAGVPFLFHRGGYHAGPASDIPHRAAFDSFPQLPPLVSAALGD